MHQSGPADIDRLNVEERLSSAGAQAEPVIKCSPINGPVGGQTGPTWLAEIEPLSILIHSVRNTYPASLYDRHMQCSVELPVEFDLESAKRSALIYADQYMRAHVGEVSWALSESVPWYEFVPVRSPEDLQQRKSGMAAQCSLAISPRPIALVRQRQSTKNQISAAGRMPTIDGPENFRPRLFLSLPEASEYTGLSRALLRRRIHSGELAAIRDRGWRVRTSDLDKI
jgi:excisionase family DNA binding protein